MLLPVYIITPNLSFYLLRNFATKSAYKYRKTVEKAFSKDDPSVEFVLKVHGSEYAAGELMQLAEAMYLGKPVIGTNWSGNTDFMDRDNSCVVDYSLIKVGEDYGPYKHHQLWAEPDMIMQSIICVNLSLIHYGVTTSPKKEKKSFINVSQFRWQVR
ncbi:hypothetical protein [Paenibacillus sp.]|jgi:hypothetical protein|uniref:hypothetical protein n=1 Tax=Paenibacillus sp. TaxID=58172 RepID=UPI00282DF7B3|nr:hypothetical protein [Paenibacillus sp.]MDR0267612.1 hypothetical protein [Paenibacillus sp.]